MNGSTTLALGHARFGTIEAPEQTVMRCQGLPGFPEARRLLILEHDRASLFAWLVCFEIPELALAVTDPANFFSDYDPNPHLSDLRAIEAKPGDPVDVLAIANVSAKGAFLNLAAPILVNPSNRLVVQAILSDGVHPVRAPIGAPAARAQNNSLGAPQVGTAQVDASRLGAAQIESKPHR